MFKIVELILEMRELLDTTAPINFNNITDKLAALNKELAKELELQK